MQLTIDRDKIIEASKQSEGVRLVLLLLFPEAFKNLPAMDVKSSMSSNASFATACCSIGLHASAITIVKNSAAHPFYLKAMELDNKYEWELSEDYRGKKILIPRLKLGVTGFDPVGVVISHARLVDSQRSLQTVNDKQARIDEGARILNMVFANEAVAA